MSEGTRGLSDWVLSPHTTGEETEEGLTKFAAYIGDPLTDVMEPVYEVRSNALLGRPDLLHPGASVQGDVETSRAGEMTHTTLSLLAVDTSAVKGDHALSGTSLTALTTVSLPHVKEFDRMKFAWVTLTLDLARGYIEIKIGLVDTRGNGEATRGKVIRGSVTGAMVDDLTTLPEEEEVIEASKGLGRRGVDDGGDGEPLVPSDTGEEGAHFETGGTIQTGGGFIEEEDGGFGDEFHANVYTLPLTAGDTTSLLVSDDGVHDVGETEILDGLEDLLLLPTSAPFDGQTTHGGVSDDITDGEFPDHDVLLRDKADELTVVLETTGTAVNVDMAGGTSSLTGEEGDEGGLTGARGAHDGAGSTRPELAGDVTHDVNTGGEGETEVFKGNVEDTGGGDKLRAFTHEGRGLFDGLNTSLVLGTFVPLNTILDGKGGPDDDEEDDKDDKDSDLGFGVGTGGAVAEVTDLGDG